MEDLDTSIMLPEKPLFILTVDTEEEWDWTGNFPRPPFSTENIEQIPEFQTFCNELGVKPTYFVDHAVADNLDHAAILRKYFDSDECDIGAHLHPWANPPMEEIINETNSHAINLPIDLFDRKITHLTEKLISTFGQHPYSYRAGRWGINEAHLKVLGLKGYRVDSSIRPFYRDKPFSYEKAPTRAYWPSDKNLLEPQTSSSDDILELPTTSGYNSPNFELLDRIHTALSKPPINRMRLIGILWQLGIVRKITVTPEGTEPQDVCRCIDACIKRGDSVINMFFHSSDLLPGCTQYVQNNSDKKRFLNNIRHCVEHLRKKYDCRMTTMREIRQQLTGSA